MAELVSSGRIVDMVLVFMTAEVSVLLLVRRLRGRGLGVLDVLGHLSAGAFLMLALRNALNGGDWTWTALFLLASLPAHLIDLGRRWRAEEVRSSPGGTDPLADD